MGKTRKRRTPKARDDLWGEACILHGRIERFIENYGGELTKGEARRLAQAERHLFMVEDNINARRMNA